MVLTKIPGTSIADDAITSAKITDGTIVSADIANTTITSGNMALDPRNASNLSSGSVPAAQLDNVDLTGLSDDIALLAFKTQTNGNLARYNLIDQSVDAFEDASGVDALSSTDAARDSSGKYYSGTTTPSGGTITTDGSDTIHTFATAGNGTSTNNFVTGVASSAVRWLLVAGGGGGGNGRGGGGGAGGYVAATGQTVGVGTHAVVVGAGGANGASFGDDGSSGANSTIGSLATANGGGGGGGYKNPTSNGVSGGSGGGQGGSEGGGGGAGSGNQGNPGGTDGGKNSGGGGGGAGQTGNNGAGTVGGIGGNGAANDITGTSVTYAGGGGGGGNDGTGGRAGGTGGGGTGGADGADTHLTAGTDGLGGGGGGGGAGADGGNGFVAIRYTTGSMDSVGNNMTLVSTTQTAQAAPTKADLVFTYTNGAGTAVLGTNITVEASMDNGSTWTDFGIAPSDVQGTTGGHTIVTKNNVTLTSTSGTSMRWRVKTLVQSASLYTRIHAVSLGWS